MRRCGRKAGLIILFVFLLLLVVSCRGGKETIVRYGWFETEGIILVEFPRQHAFMTVSLPSEVLEAWYYSLPEGSSPSARSLMESFSGLKSQGSFGGSSDDLMRLRRLLDTLARQDSTLDGVGASARRIQVLEKFSGDLRKTQLPVTLSELSGLDAADLLHRAQGGARSMAYDASEFLSYTEDITQAQAWFVSWLEGAMQEILRRSTENE